MGKVLACRQSAFAHAERLQRDTTALGIGHAGGLRAKPLFYSGTIGQLASFSTKS